MALSRGGGVDARRPLAEPSKRAHMVSRFPLPAL